VCTIKCRSIIFGVTLRLLVINTSSSSRANNKRRRYTSDECHQLATVRFVVFITPCGRSGTTRDEARYWPKIAIFAARRSVSVCPSVRPSRSSILSKQINISSIFFTIRNHTILVFPYLTLWQYSNRTLTGASKSDGVGKNRYSRPIGSMTAGVR